MIYLMSIQGLEQLVLLPAGLLNSEHGAESFQKWTNSWRISRKLWQISSRSSSIFFHLFMRDSISRFLHVRISSTAQWMSWKPQVQQSHCRASMATTGEKAWVCRSRWKGPEKLALGFQLPQNWYLLFDLFSFFQVFLNNQNETSIPSSDDLSSWTTGNSSGWDAQLGPCGTRLFTTLRSMKSDCKNGRSMSTGARRFFWTISSTQHGLVFLSFVAANALCSLAVRDHVGRNPSHDVCTKLQLCTRIIGNHLKMLIFHRNLIDLEGS